MLAESAILHDRAPERRTVHPSDLPRGAVRDQPLLPVLHLLPRHLGVHYDQGVHRLRVAPPDGHYAELPWHRLSGTVANQLRNIKTFKKLQKR